MPQTLSPYLSWELWQGQRRGQRERQKSNRLNNHSVLECIIRFDTFLCRHIFPIKILGTSY